MTKPVHILTLHSFRRGVGKSTFAANLAAMLVENGRSVGLIDLNLQSPSLHHFFGLDRPETTLNDVLWQETEIVEAVYPVLEHRNGGQLCLVPASSTTRDLRRALTGELQLEQLVESIQQLADTLSLELILLDTYAGLHEETMQAMALADSLLILLRPDQQDFQGTAVLVDVAKRLNVPDVQLIVNQLLSHFDPSHVQAKIEKTYDCRVTAVLPHASELLTLTSSNLFVHQFPQHPYTQLLNALASDL